MGSPISGREMLIAAVKGTAWGTPVVCAANHGLLAKTFTLGQAFEILPDQPLGTGWETATESGRQNCAGEMTGEFRYDGQELVLIAMAMGTAGAPAQQGATLAYLHTLQLADTVNGLFATLIRKMKSDLVFEFPSVKPMGLTLKGGKRIPTTYQIPLLGNTLNRNGGSGTNTTTTIASVTYRDKRNRGIMYESAYCRVNDQSGGALGSGDAILISDFTLTFTRPMEGDHVLDGNSYVTEPVGSGFPECTLALTFPQFTDAGATLWALLGTNPLTAKKIEIFLQGGVADQTFNYQMTIQIPQAFLATIEANPTGPGKIPNPMTFRLTQAQAAPAGMSGITNPFALKVINKRTTDLLA